LVYGGRLGSPLPRLLQQLQHSYVPFLLLFLCLFILKKIILLIKFRRFFEETNGNQRADRMLSGNSFQYFLCIKTEHSSKSKDNLHDPEKLYKAGLNKVQAEMLSFSFWKLQSESRALFDHVK
jgi:hypothetical protein